MQGYRCCRPHHSRQYKQLSFTALSQPRTHNALNRWALHRMSTSPACIPHGTSQSDEDIENEIRELESRLEKAKSLLQARKQQPSTSQPSAHDATAKQAPIKASGTLLETTTTKTKRPPSSLIHPALQ